ncbi:MAG: signal recognition particle-docking protein FtsY [Alphaproteobacteria bacterium]
MAFWRNKNKQSRSDEEKRDDRLMHPKGEPELEPSTDYDPDIDESMKQRLNKTDNDFLKEVTVAPVPEHRLSDDLREAEELSDHTEEGGWLSRLSSSLSKSSAKMARGFTDVLTKSKLDEESLQQLEDVLVEADLGPKTAAKIVADFSEGRFGKEATDEEVRGALAETIERILKPVTKPLSIDKPAAGPFVILVCGVNGAGKTTTIGKLAHQLHFRDRLKVMMAAGDTFRAAAVEQLQEWSKRAAAGFYAKDLGADAAALAFEAYEKAEEEGSDVLIIDTAGRLQNKANLMEELRKIVRVLKKKSGDLPHAVLLVLDSTTGQNAYSQVKTFKEMVDVTGLVVTKLDGSAKGGVVVGLADQFGIPVHAIGIGEDIEDLQAFKARDYARSLMGLK